MKMTKIERSIIIHRPLEEVFSFVTDAKYSTIHGNHSAVYLASVTKLKTSSRGRWMIILLSIFVISISFSKKHHVGYNGYDFP